MIAIIRDGGRQYRVEEGKTVYLDLRAAKAGDKIELNEVLAIENGKQARFGRPLLDGAKVVAEVVGETQGPKVIFHRFRRRKNSHRRQGHRQCYTEVRIQAIVG